MPVQIAPPENFEKNEAIEGLTFQMDWSAKSNAAAGRTPYEPVSFRQPYKSVSSRTEFRIPLRLTFLSLGIGMAFLTERAAIAAGIKESLP